MDKHNLNSLNPGEFANLPKQRESKVSAATGQILYAVLGLPASQCSQKAVRLYSCRFQGKTNRRSVKPCP